jgi:Domain of unknown function (DUF4124)
MKPLVFTFLLLISASAAAQELYKWKDDKGQWYLSTTAPAGGESETLGVKERPRELAKSVACTPFKTGETRKAISFYRGINSPLQMIDIELRRLQGDGEGGYFSWKVVMQNFSSRPVVTGGIVKLEDCGEFLIAQAKMPAWALPPFATVTVDGTTGIEGSPYANVGRFTVEIGDTAGTDKPPATSVTY